MQRSIFLDRNRSKNKTCRNRKAFAFLLLSNQWDQVIEFERGGLNFSPSSPSSMLEAETLSVEVHEPACTSGEGLLIYRRRRYHILQRHSG